MKYTVISSHDLAECPQKRMDPRHWIGGHHVEECDPVLIRLVRLKEEELASETAKKIEAIRLQRDQDLQDYKLRLRKEEA